MKLKTTHLAAVAAALVTHAQATVLLTDNFDSENNSASTFNNNLASTQSGTLAPVAYTVTTGGATWQAQHSNGGAMLLVSNGYSWAGGYASTASLNHNFASNASGPLSVSFDASWADGQDDASDWFCFTIGSAQNTYGDNSSVGYGVLFRFSGATQQFHKGGSIGSTAANTWSANTSAFQTVTIMLSDGNAGSAFNGNGSVANLYSGNTLISSLTLSTQLTSSDGYMTFAAGPYNGDYAVVNFDNLNVSVVPEPSAALLGGIGLLALLRRRR